MSRPSGNDERVPLTLQRGARFQTGTAYMAIITRDEVKTFLNIPSADDSRDMFIDTMIPVVEDFVKEYCANDFIDDNGEEAFPPGIKLPVARLIGHDLRAMSLNAGDKDVTAEWLGEYSIKYAVGSRESLTGSYPKALMLNLRPWKRVRAT